MKLKEKILTYLAHFSCRICFLLTGAFLFSILPLIIIKADEFGIHSGIGWWKAGSLTSIISGYLFCSIFFIETGKRLELQNRLKASRTILYVIVLGLQFLIGSSCLMIKQYNDEKISEFYFITALILWIYAIVLAILNKIQVNKHYQD